ncbi:MAG: hypothetical protein AAGC81_08880, partial [Pseudomonadota bacterium]
RDHIQAMKLTTSIIGNTALPATRAQNTAKPKMPISEQSSRRNDTKPPAYPFYTSSQSQRAASSLEPEGLGPEAIGGEALSTSPPVSAGSKQILFCWQHPFFADLKVFLTRIQASEIARIPPWIQSIGAANRRSP